MSNDAPSRSHASNSNLPDRRHSRLHLGGSGSRARVRPLPLGRLLLYYLIVALVLGALAWFFPLVRRAYLSPIEAPVLGKSDALNLTMGAAPAQAVGMGNFGSALERTGTTLLAVAGALLLALPVAWVYMFTKRLRYDASLVQSVIILPVVITGILMIVKTSLILAFSLAGIVGAVRFRNTLKDPKDAVYVFLVLSIGIAAGVQALDIAFVLSLAFSVIVLGLWKFNVGAIYSNEYGPRGILNIGDRRLMTAQSPAERGEVRERLSEEMEDMKKPDGVLLVHTTDPDSARHAVESSLSQIAKDWKVAGVTEGPRGTSTVEFVVRLKKKSTLVELLGELDDRWPAQVAAAEFVPLGTEKGGES
ncbi:MAG TPA: DUF4956 domain-containing protein [Longimicrobiaceae bacterium]|nr:DUF4956 domain-containing protein [Longimicrobiaceae bacterium]